MNKTLKQIQEENRKFIIMANNPTAKTYDEALEMELGKVGCNFEYLIGGVEREAISIGEQFKGQISIQSWDDMMISKEYVTKIIGKPLTLNRLLVSINKHFEFFKNYNKYLNDKHILEFENPDKPFSTQFMSETLFSWDLEKETLEEQSEETQREINKLFN